MTPHILPFKAAWCVMKPGLLRAVCRPLCATHPLFLIMSTRFLPIFFSSKWPSLFGTTGLPTLSLFFFRLYILVLEPFLLWNISRLVNTTLPRKTVVVHFRQTLVKPREQEADCLLWDCVVTVDVKDVWNDTGLILDFVLFLFLNFIFKNKTHIIHIRSLW